jgi:hypothetical protein
MTVAPFTKIDRDHAGRVVRVTPVHFIALKDIRPLNLKQIERMAA